MKTYKIRSVQEHGQGDITILHSNGAFHYNEQDVTLKEWTNNQLIIFPFLNVTFIT